VLTAGSGNLNTPKFQILPVQVAARSKAWVYGRSPAENAGSNRTGGMDVCLLSGRGLCDELITRLDESY
jgi:hypothetical protein